MSPRRYEKTPWNHPSLKNVSARQVCNLLKRLGYEPESRSAPIVFRHPETRISKTVHFHKGSDTFGKEIWKLFIQTNNWTLEDLRKHKLVK